MHEPEQARAAADVVDALQIPAFLCRQTDLLVAAGATGLPVNVKKGQWMAPEEMAGAAEKVRKGGSQDLAVTERGTAFGYGDLIVDMRSFGRLRRATGATVLFDATHAAQRPGQGARGSSGGDRESVPALLLAPRQRVPTGSSSKPIPIRLGLRAMEPLSGRSTAWASSSLEPWKSGSWREKRDSWAASARRPGPRP